MKNYRITIKLGENNFTYTILADSEDGALYELDEWSDYLADYTEDEIEVINVEEVAE